MWEGNTTGSGGTSPPASLSLAFVNVVKAYGVDNTGATDAGPKLQTAFNALAGTGQAAWLPPGIYKIATLVNLPSNLIIWGDPNTLIEASGIAGWMWQAIYTPRVPGATTSLAADISMGALSASLTATIAGTIVAGVQILITNAAGVGQIYRVVSISGGGPYSAVLDRPVMQPLLAAGSAVQVVTARPTDIRIYGNGMRMEGTAWRYLDIMGGLRCLAWDIYVDGSLQTAGNYSISMDLYGFENEMARIHSDGGGQANVAACVATESNERTRLIDCVASNGSASGASAGIMVTNGIDVEVRGCSATGCIYGIVNCCDFDSSGKSWRTQIIGGAYSGNQYGGLIDGGGVYPGGSADTFSSGTSWAGNQISGLVVGAGAIGTHLVDPDISQNGLSGASLAYLALAASTLVEGVRCNQADNGGQLIVCTAGESTILGAELGVTSANNSTIGVYANGASLVKVRDLHVTVSAAASVQAVVGAYCASGVLDVDGMAMDGAGASGGAVEGIVSVATTTLRLGGRIAVDGCGIPHAIAGYCSRSLGDAAPNDPIVANGASAVDVTWPDLQSTDRVVLSLSTKGGSPSAMPLVTYTPGTKFTLTSYTLDTSSYDYVVGP